MIEHTSLPPSIVSIVRPTNVTTTSPTIQSSKASQDISWKDTGFQRPTLALDANAVAVTGKDNQTFIQEEESIGPIVKQLEDGLGAHFIPGTISNSFANRLLDNKINKEEADDPTIKEHALVDTLKRSGEDAINRAKLRARAVQVEHLETLLIEQEQYLQGRINDQENILANEIRNTYCAVMKLRQNQAILMAQFDPILAAKSLGLKTCDSVSGHGETLILQECTPIEVEIEGIITECGPQPIARVNNVTFSLSPNSYSLVPYFNCLHRSKYVSIGGETYAYIDGNWVKQEPVVHINNLKLVGKFPEIFLKEYDLTSTFPEYYNYNPMDQLTMLAAILGSIQEHDPQSPEGILTSVNESSLLNHAFQWIDYLKYITIGILSFIALSLIIRIIACCNPLPALRNLWISIFSTARNLPDHIQMQTVRAEPPGQSMPPGSALFHAHNDTVFIGNRLLWKGCGCPLA